METNNFDAHSPFNFSSPDFSSTATVISLYMMQRQAGKTTTYSMREQELQFR